jgi:DNA-binding PadR family transcriptional regulator
MPAELTTTSYAILGLLALKPWTTYELAQQMDRAISEFWPRTRSKLYEEPKKLVTHGLAKAKAEKVGNRPRTVYSITPKGRKALAAWMREPVASKGPALEFEQLMKVFFAEFGSKDDLLATLAGLRPYIDAQHAQGVEICRGYLDGNGPFPDRLAWNILVGEFLSGFEDLVTRWVDWATETVEGWPDDVRDAEPDLETLERMARHHEDYVRRRSISETPLPREARG